MQYLKIPIDAAQAILNCLATRPYAETLWNSISLPEMIRTSKAYSDEPVDLAPKIPEEIKDEVIS